jgi:hypothetical protein
MFVGLSDGVSSPGSLHGRRFTTDQGFEQGMVTFFLLPSLTAQAWHGNFSFLTDDFDGGTNGT